MAHPRMYDDDDPLLVRLRPICLTLPETSERESHGRPNFFAGKRVFASYGVAGDDDHRLIFHPGESERPALVADPRFTVPPYYGPSGWLALDLADDPDWDEVAELVTESYRRVALVRMLRDLRERPSAIE